MDIVVSLLALAPFMAAQGAAIFTTAFLTARLLRTDTALSKILQMVLSWLAWVVLTIGGYTLFGGEGGLMDGFGLILMLCSISVIPTAIFTVFWVIWPKAQIKAHS